jgi:CDP-6-deoxy-D-xylo-4-hexulose-3-dehydrase
MLANKNSSRRGMASDATARRNSGASAGLPAGGIMMQRRQIGVGGVNVSERAKRLVSEVLDSGRLTAGPMMSRFEQEFASYHGCRFGLMCNSGTSALQIGLAALKEMHGWKDGDEVLVPSVTFVASSNVVMYNGLKPVFVDVDPLYYGLDPSQIERRLTPRTRAIIPVHLCGMPCDMGPITQIARAHDLRIIEDSCETMFARDGGTPVGSFGDIGCFSTYVAHVISTGVGGLCTTNNPDLILLLKSLMNHGRDSIYIRIDDDRRATSSELFDVVDRRFSFVRLGHSFRCTEMEAALGLVELEERERSVARRRSTAGKYTAGLANLQDRLRLPAVRPGSEHVFMFYPITIIDGRTNRNELILYLEERGIETRYLLPLINQPVYRDLFGNLDEEYPVAAMLNANAFYIGCHPGITDDETDYVIATFQDFFEDR